MSDTAWIIESGEYSAYTVHAVFTSEEQADEACRLMNMRYGDKWRFRGEDEYRVNSLPLNPDVRKMDARFDELEKGWIAGFTVFVSGEGTTTDCDTWKEELSVDFLSNETAVGIEEDVDTFRVQVAYDECDSDPEKAKKIAWDKIAEWKAIQQGIA